MKVARFALIGVFCLVLLDKWAGLGFIWPETSEKRPDRPRTVSKWHPSVAKPSNVVSFDDYQAWYRRQWSAE